MKKNNVKYVKYKQKDKKLHDTIHIIRKQTKNSVFLWKNKEREKNNEE